MALSVGDKLGPYEIMSLLGEGGMGQVWKARDTRLERFVAIKTSRQQFNERFEREARAVAALNHPNICALYDVGPDYLVMEFVNGPSLAERMSRGAMPLEKAWAIARQIAEALEAAHDKGIVHRDLKPENIKFTAEGAVKVLDFGLAKAVETDRERATAVTITAGPTGAGTILGTPAYMSPEQAAGDTVDKRTDIWAFAVVLWELVTGRRMFDGPSAAHVLAAVLKDEPDIKAAPETLRPVLSRCDSRQAGMDGGNSTLRGSSVLVLLNTNPSLVWQSDRSMRTSMPLTSDHRRAKTSPRRAPVAADISRNAGRHHGPLAHWVRRSCSDGSSAIPMRFLTFGRSLCVTGF